MFKLNTQALFKYVLEGFAVAVVARMILGDRIGTEEVLMLGLTAAASFAVLDAFAPGVSLGTRLGAGFGLGKAMIPVGYRDASESGL
jgi:hypothetical protein